MELDWRSANLLASRFWPKRGFRPAHLHLAGTSGRAPDARSRSRPALASRSSTSATASCCGRAAPRRALSTSPGRPRRAPLPALRLAARGARLARRHGDARRRGARAAATGRARRPAPLRARGPRSTSWSGWACRRTRQTILVAGGLNRRAVTASWKRCSRPRSRAASTAGSRCTTRRRPTSSMSATPDARPCASTRCCSRPTSSSASPPRRPCSTAGRARCSEPAARRRCAGNGLLAARDRRLTGLAARRRARAEAAGRVPVFGTSLVLNPPRLTGRFRGYPYEDGSLAQVARSPLRRSPCSLRDPAPAAPGHGPRADRRRRLRRPAVRRARRGAPARDRPALDPARAAARRDRDRHAVEAPALAARAAEPDHGRDRRARARASALARRLPGRGRRHGDRAPPALASLRTRHPGSVPRALPCAPRRAHRRGPRGRRARGRRGHAGA